VPARRVVGGAGAGAELTAAPAREAYNSAVAERQLYIVEVDDRCDPRLVGHSGSSYASPPQPEVQALALVRMLLGPSSRPLQVSDEPFRAPIAGGQRVIRLHRAGPDGQLQISG